MHEAHVETGLRLEALRFSTSDSALTLTHGCARCTREGKIHVILHQILEAALRHANSTEQLICFDWLRRFLVRFSCIAHTWFRRYVLFLSCATTSGYDLLSEYNIYTVWWIKLICGRGVKQRAVKFSSVAAYHISPFEHCVDSAAGQFSVDPCR